MTRVAFAAALGLLLAGCLGGAPAGTGYRDGSVPLSVTTRGTPGDMSGPWFIRGYFKGDQSIAMVTFLPEWQGGEALELLRAGCDLAGDCDTEGEVWRRRALGQNRWHVASPDGRQSRELWLVWADEDFRTAAIGTPDGSYGWILDRKATGGEDRIVAARQILQFNGYDTGAMIMR